MIVDIVFFLISHYIKGILNSLKFLVIINDEIKIKKYTFSLVSHVKEFCFAFDEEPKIHYRCF